MKVNWEGRTYQLDENVISLKQGVEIHKVHGLTLMDYINGLRTTDFRSLAVAYWQMLVQNGDTRLRLADVDLPDAIDWAAALADAKKAEKAEAAAEPEPEPAPAVPTIPAPAGDQPSPASSSPTAMTPQPQPIAPQPLPPPTGY